MFKEFGITNLEVTKDDIYKNPSNPILRMYDDDELIGTFSILTGEVLENLDLADYDIRFAQKQIELNRRLEIAQQNAQAEEAARIKAEKEKLEAETQAREAEELANANARNLEIARKQLEEKETEHAKKVAELQAQIDALAKGQAKEVLAEENGEDKAVEEAETKRKSPPKKDKKASQESATVDLEDLDQ